MSAFLVLAVVSVVAFAALRVSINIYTRCMDQFKKDENSKKLIMKMALILSPILWLVIFFFPVDYGIIPREIKLWITLWSMKTIGYFLAPAIVAVLTTLYLQRKS